MGSPHGDRGPQGRSHGPAACPDRAGRQRDGGRSGAGDGARRQGRQPCPHLGGPQPVCQPPGPIRGGHRHHTATGQVVLFGGYDSGGLVGDTWTWNGTTWTQQFPATSPSASAGDTMATDPTNGHALLFDRSTWEWSGSNWVSLSPCALAAGPALRVDGTDPRPGRSCCSGDSTLPTPTPVSPTRGRGTASTGPSRVRLPFRRPVRPRACPPTRQRDTSSCSEGTTARLTGTSTTPGHGMERTGRSRARRPAPRPGAS